MKKRNFRICGVLIAALLLTAAASGTVHPSLLLTRDGAAQIRAVRGTLPAFDRSLDADIALADRAIADGIVLPPPTDGGGGYSHEKHKQNYYALYHCGVAWQITGEEKYAEFAARMLLAYADLYPTLGTHPVQLSKTPGRLFWQTLNECVWLVHASIAYDCIHDYLSESRKNEIEKNLLRPMADFIMDGTPQNAENRATFNRMHNHGTWAVAAVGMAGLAVGDDDYVRKALYGTDLTGRNGGFMMQMDRLFSPDGYFTEGAYYQRYAIWPFVLFAQAVDNRMPQLDIFNHRGRILEKALDVLIQLAYDGRFMKFNDALDKGYDAQEMVYAVDIVYKSNPAKKELLGIAERYQGKFLPTDAGYAVARGISLGEARQPQFRSVLLRDGTAGEEGGVAIIRPRERGSESALLLKATSHGLSHGHYDKLNMVYYDNGTDVIADYGAARFVNVEAKNKGHYTRENKSFAMSTVAHNTVVADQTSHYGGNIAVSSRHHPTVYLARLGSEPVQVFSAVDSTAYDGIRMQRTTAWIETGFLEHPLILDLFSLSSAVEHTYDFPLWFNGHIVGTTFSYQRPEIMSAMGAGDGYRHLWVEAAGRSEGGTECFTWLANNRFYSASAAVPPGTEFYVVRSGADDPDFNLRSQQARILRVKASGHTFAAAIETHGGFDPATEAVDNVAASVERIALAVDSEEHTVVCVSFRGGQTLTFCLAKRDNRPQSRHRIAAADQIYEWEGPCHVKTKQTLKP